LKKTNSRENGGGYIRPWTSIEMKGGGQGEKSIDKYPNAGKGKSGKRRPKGLLGGGKRKRHEQGEFLTT